MKEETGTATHAEHTSLLDEVGFNTADGQQSLRDTSGRLGITSIGNQHTISTYSNSDDQHRPVLNKQGREMNFNSERDARDFIEEHDRRVKAQVVVTESSPASVADEERAYHSAQRRAKEAADGDFGNKSSGVLLG